MPLLKSEGRESVYAICIVGKFLKTDWNSANRPSDPNERPVDPRLIVSHMPGNST